MSGPDFIAQCGDPMTDEQRREWVKRTAEEFRNKGSMFSRITLHAEIPDLILFEGWRERPEDQGKPRFQLTPQ